MYGRANDDAAVLSVGYIFEKLTRVREKLKPWIVPKTDLAGNA